MNRVATVSSRRKMYGNLCLELHPQNIGYYKSFSLRGITVRYYDKKWWATLEDGQHFAQADAEMKELIADFCQNYNAFGDHQQQIKEYVKKKRAFRRKKASAKIVKQLMGWLK